EVGVPAGDALFDIARVIRHRIDTDTLEHDHGAAPLDDAEEDVVGFWSLKRDLEAEAIAIERQRVGDVPDDEERRNGGDFRFEHVGSSARAAGSVHAMVGGVEDELVRELVRYGAPLLFFAQVFGIFGLPIPDELLMTVAGALIASGRLDLSSTL